jgi:hypothetical protein
MQSADFRERLPELWTKLTRIIQDNHQTFDLYLDDIRIWDILALSEGERLVQEWGLLPIDLLYGYPQLNHDPYPVDLHHRVIQILLAGNNPTLHALINLRNEPLFRALLRRELEPANLASACQKLYEAEPDTQRLLQYYAKLDDKGLTAEVDFPASGLKTWIPLYYTVYEVPKKLLQGREPTAMDWFQAFADLVSIGLPVLKNSHLEAPLPAPSAQSMRSALTTIGREVAQRQVGQQVAKLLSFKEGVKFSISGVLAQIQPAVRATLAKGPTREITHPIQFLFRYGNVGRKTLQTMEQLEARVFLHTSAKVGVRLSPVGAVAGALVRQFLNETAMSLGTGIVVESGPGQEVIRDVASGVQSSWEWMEETWRQHVSAWWLLNASGMQEAARGR